MDLYAKRTFLIDTENAFKIGPHIAALNAAGHSVIKLNLGEPDFDVPEFIKAEIKRQLDNNNTHYCDPKGILSLREAISHKIETTRNLHVSPEQVVIFPGAKPAIGFSQHVYCNPGDEVIYPSPGFPIFESFIHYLGASPVPAHLSEENDFTLSAEHLSSLITAKTKMIFLNFPSNPTGGVISQEQLEAIATVILEKCHPNVRVYSDEIYADILFDNLHYYSIASIPGMEKRTIISSGFSKAFSWTGGRVGYAAFPTIEEADIFKNLNINYFSCVPPYNQEAARVALEHPDSQKSVLQMVKVFQERRDYIVKALN
ncbi:MAG TPA: aminotransferase class I/II-fold pyridoxal phosphate-dependent enzyme, partial [Gammaproteobacteria bacterium]|nr:aminotransferase class I/II-fold pyridoxal phosphate-dependent enzyme [Gammaproteobacteria bacterium]